MSPQQVKTGAYVVKDVRHAAPEEWDGWLMGSPGGGHALQSHAWGEFKRGQGWEPLRLLLEKDDEVAGAGLFMARATYPVPGSLMYCPRGPWLPWDDEEAVRAFFEGAAEISRREGAHTVKIDPEVLTERAGVEELLHDVGFRRSRYDLNFRDTIIVDLSPSEEDLLAGMGGKTTRYNVRLAGRKGVEVREPEDFEWAFDTLHGWMRNLDESKEGYQITRPREYFHGAMRTMHDAGQGRFFFAFHEGEPLAAAYFFYFGHKLWYLYSAATRDGQKLKPNYLLQWEVMRWAKLRGITYYDMVSVPRPENRNESDPSYGVYKFKKGFGGEVVEFVGCMDLPVKPRLAAAWHRLEPLYQRLYPRLKKDIFY